MDRNLSIRLSVQDAQTVKLALEQLGKDGQAALRSIQQGAEPASHELLGLGETVESLKRTLEGFGIALGVRELVNMGVEAVKSAGDLRSLAQQLGVGIEKLQGYQYAAATAGVSQDELEVGIASLTRRIGEAAQGNQAAIKTFDRLGVGVLDASGKIRSTDAVLVDVADALKAIQDPAQRAAAEVALLGQAGQRLETILAGGSARLSDLEAEAKAAGLTLSNDMVARADEAAAALERLDLRVERLKETIAIAIAGPLGDLIDWLGRVGKADSAGTAFGGPGIEAIARTADIEKTAAAIEGVTAKLAQAKRDLAAGRFALPGQGDAYIASLNKQLAELQVRLRGLQQMPTSPRGAMAAITLPPGPTHNPAPTGAAAASAGDRTPAIREETSALDDLLSSMQDENALLGQTDAARERSQALIKASAAAQKDYDAGLRDSPLLTGDEVRSIDGLIAARQRQNAADEEAKALQDELSTGEQEVAQVHDQVRTAAERYADAVEHLNSLLAYGLSSEDYGRALHQLTAEYDVAGQEIANFAGQAFDRIGADFTTMATQGKVAWLDIENVGMAVLSELEQEVLKLALLNPLKNWINGNDALPTITGVVDSLFGGSSPGNLGASANRYGGVTASGGGGLLSDVGDFVASLFHDGGIVGDANAVRLVSASDFIGAERFHAGGGPGLAPDEVAAVLRKGETVRTREQEAALGKGRTSVVVNNYTGQQATTRRSRDGQGNELIEVIVGQMVRDVKGNGPLSRAIGDRFGLTRAPVARR